MAIFEKIFEKSVEYITEATIESIRENLNFPELNAIKKHIDSLPETLGTSLIELRKWAYSIPFIGTGSSTDTQKTSIPLSISTGLSYYSESGNAAFIREFDLLTNESNSLLIGHPGSGKTTTLKRLALKYFEEINNDTIKYNYAILIRLRTLTNNETLGTHFLDKLGIPYKTKVITHDDKDDERKFSINNISMESFLPRFLNRSKCLLLVDGIDELPYSIKDNVYKELEEVKPETFNGKNNFHN